VLTAHDGPEAIDSAAEFRPEIVLLDIGLPRMNGLEVCRRIREEPWGKAMIVIALTGWGQEEDRLKSKEAGFDHHLVKPVELARLGRLLEQSEAAG
jgi:CheY-like chemotaxis protein